jgi:hypothetical protein
MIGILYAAKVDGERSTEGPRRVLGASLSTVLRACADFLRT